jgi:hypothetical protein
MNRLLLIAACAALGGCLWRTPGGANRIDFQAVIDDQLGGAWAVTPIAPGTAVTIRALEHDRSEALPITEWMLDEPSIVSAARDGAGDLKLVALRPGTATLRVRSGILEDNIVIVVVEPVSAEVLRPLASEASSGPLLAISGERGELPISHLGPNRESVLALGRVPPVRLEPEGLARVIDPGPRGGARLHLAFAAPGKLTIVGGSGPALDIEIAERARIDAISAEPTGGNGEGRDLGTYVIRVVFGGRKWLLSSGGFTVEIATPSVCALATGDIAKDTKRVFGEGAFSVTALTAGRCEGTVRVGDQHDLFVDDMAPRPARAAAHTPGAN